MKLPNPFSARRDALAKERARGFAAGIAQRPRQARMFQAGSIDRLTSDWTSTPLSADQIVFRNLRTLRARSRAEFCNNDFAERFICMVKQNVIGAEGILFQSRLSGGAPRDDEALNRIVNRAWRDWGDRENCDASCRSGWVDQQNQFIGTVALDGEYIALQDESPTGYGYKIRALDPELLDITHNMSAVPGGGYIRMGVECLSTGRPVAYHLLDPAATSNLWGGSRSNRIRVPAEQCTHEFITDMVGQSRGLPWMSTALFRMRNLGAYEDAAIMAARVGAANMGLIETPPDDGSTGFQGDGEDANGNPEIQVDPASFQRLNPGEKLTPWNPDYPRGEFEPFMKRCLRGIASGLGVSYNVFANDLEGVNYSSIRAGLVEEREVWKALQSWVVTVYCRPHFRRWLTRAITIGAVPIHPDLITPICKSAVWSPRRWAWVDPLKDQQANQTSIANRTTSISQIIREQSQREPEEVWLELSGDIKRLKELGIAISAPTAVAVTSPASSTDDSDSESEQKDETNEDENDQSD